MARMAMFLAAASVSDVIIVALAVLVFWLLPAYFVARLAKRKGRSFWLWLTFSLIFPWVWFLVAIVVLKPMQREDRDSGVLA